mgnify:CR=1 FL=1
MTKKKDKTVDLNSLEPDEKMKYEVAEELGLLDRVLKEGWKSLTSKETGRIGGMVTKRKKQGKSSDI